MKQIIALITFAALMIFISSCSQNNSKRNLSQKEVFTVGYPQSFWFRGDTRAGSSYAEWESAHLPFYGSIQKYLEEEVNVDPKFAGYASQYEKDHPEKLMLIHLNGEGMAASKKEVQEEFFPGHWVYEAGSPLGEDVSVSDTVIKVENAAPFSTEAYAMHGGGRIRGRLPHDLILVDLDENGNRIWNSSEYVTIKAVDYEKNELIVKRGCYFTQPRTFKKGMTYVAPLAGDYWGGNLMWYYNLSSVCPKDDRGRNCADVFLSVIVENFSDGGLLHALDGIAFDVNYFMVTDHRTWDCNNDGIADRGIVDGINVWRLGDLDFLNKLRSSFGEEFIITADGWRKEMQCAVGILNGMETEGLCRPNDGYRQISRTINQQTYWKLSNTAKYDFRYITAKLMNPEDRKISSQLNRLGLGVASCLEAAFTGTPAVGQNNWLGKTVSELQFIPKSTPDLLDGEGTRIQSDFSGNFDSGSAEITVSNNSVHIKGTESNPRADMIVKGPGVDISDGDIVIFFEAKAIDGLVDLNSKDRIPRKINVSLEDYVEATGETNKLEINLSNNLSGLIGTKDFTPHCYYFRNVGHGDKPVRFIMEIEEQGEIEIRNMTIHNAPLVMYREFQNGKVFLNTSKEDYPLDVDKYPDLVKDKYEVLSNEGDGAVQLDNKPVVKALDALFLSKK